MLEIRPDIKFPFLNIRDSYTVSTLMGEVMEAGVKRLNFRFRWVNKRATSLNCHGRCWVPAPPSVVLMVRAFLYSIAFIRWRSFPLHLLISDQSFLAHLSTNLSPTLAVLLQTTPISHRHWTFFFTFAFTFYRWSIWNVFSSFPFCWFTYVYIYLTYPVYFCAVMVGGRVLAFRVPTAIRLAVRTQKIKAFARKDEYRNLKSRKKKKKKKKKASI